METEPKTKKKMYCMKTHFFINDTYLDKEEDLDKLRKQNII